MRLRNLLWLVVVVFLVLFAYRFFVRATAGTKEAAEKIIPVVLAQPQIGTIEARLTVTGDVRGETEVAVRPKIAGRVAEIYVNEGDKVQAGDRLFSYLAGLGPEDELYQDMTTFAPISGVVGLKQIKVGEQITSTAGVINPVFTIYQIGRVKVYGDVPEKYYSLIKKGTNAQIQLDAIPGRLFTGRVNYLRPVIDPLTRTTQVEIIIPNPSQLIRPGMFSKISLLLAKKSNVLTLPTDAVLGLDDKYVFIEKGGLAVKKPVVTGIQQADQIEVVSGLQPDDRVIVVGQRVVTEGSKIEAVKE